MPVEGLIYLYLAVCAGLIGFNLTAAARAKHRERRIARKADRMERRILRQLPLLEAAGLVEEGFLRGMERRLRRVESMLALDAALERLQARQPEQVWALLRAMNGVTVALAEDYCRRRDDVEAAFFPYIIRKYRLLQGRRDRTLEGLLLELLRQPSIYCRESAMQAIYTAGDPALVVQALKIIDSERRFYHGRLISNGLLNDQSDRQALDRALWAVFDELGPELQLALLNYFRYSSGGHAEKMLALLQDPERDDELRFSCLRYLGHYPYAPAYETLLELAEPDRERRWEYAAVAAAALAAYPGEETLRVLRRDLCHANWYVRDNAARSMERLGCPWRELEEVMASGDRFAAEMLRYRLEERELEPEREEDAACTMA